MYLFHLLAGISLARPGLGPAEAHRREGTMRQHAGESPISPAPPKQMAAPWGRGCRGHGGGCGGWTGMEVLDWPSYTGGGGGGAKRPNAKSHSLDR